MSLSQELDGCWSVRGSLEYEHISWGSGTANTNKNVNLEYSVCVFTYCLESINNSESLFSSFLSNCRFDYVIDLKFQLRELWSVQRDRYQVTDCQGHSTKYMCNYVQGHTPDYMCTYVQDHTIAEYMCKGYRKEYRCTYVQGHSKQYRCTHVQGHSTEYRCTHVQGHSTEYRCTHVQGHSRCRVWGSQTTSSLLSIR